jgi:hypothetical protein
MCWKSEAGRGSPLGVDIDEDVAILNNFHLYFLLLLFLDGVEAVDSGQDEILAGVGQSRRVMPTAFGEIL